MSNEILSNDREKGLHSRPLKRKINGKGLTIATKVVKRRGLVRRTHSPKTIPSPTLFSLIANVTKAESGEGESLKEGVKSNEDCLEVPLLPPTVEGIAQAARFIRGLKVDFDKVQPGGTDGSADRGIIAFPSETIYLLGCNASDVNAIRMCEFWNHYIKF